MSIAENTATKFAMIIIWSEYQMVSKEKKAETDFQLYII